MNTKGITLKGIIIGMVAAIFIDRYVYNLSALLGFMGKDNKSVKV